MLKVDNLSYAYSDKYLFENLGFHLDIKTIIEIFISKIKIEKIRLFQIFFIQAIEMVSKIISL